MKRALVVLALVAAAGTMAAAQPTEIKPAENLVAQGLPPIPAALADQVGRYTEFRSANFQSWHPRRREMLITTRFADTLQVHHVRFPGGDRRQLTFFPDRVTDASFQPTRGDYFLFVKDQGGGRISPLTNAHRITKPLFVVQGRNDPRVPRTESEQMVATVQKNGSPVWYLMANDEGHGFAKKRNQDFLFYATVLFMQQHLLN